MGTPSIPLARPRPEQAERDPLDEIIPLNPRLKGPLLGRGGVTSGYQPSSPAPEQNPPQSVSGIFRAQEPGGQSNRALLTLMKTIESELSPESIDGIEPCGYDEI